MTRYQHEILERAKSYGLVSGFTVPSNIPGHRMGSCSFATKYGQEVPQRNLLAAELLGAFAFHAARRIASSDSIASTSIGHLSRRQRECVILAAQGKSDGVIAQLLGLSQNTITNYLTHARARFKVADRTQLAVAALYAGEIDFREVISSK